MVVVAAAAERFMGFGLFVDSAGGGVITGQRVFIYMLTFVCRGVRNLLLLTAGKINTLTRCFGCCLDFYWILILSLLCTWNVS